MYLNDNDEIKQYGSWGLLKDLHSIPFRFKYYMYGIN